MSMGTQCVAKRNKTFIPVYLIVEPSQKRMSRKQEILAVFGGYLLLLASLQRNATVVEILSASLQRNVTVMELVNHAA